MLVLDLGEKENVLSSLFAPYFDVTRKKERSIEMSEVIYCDFLMESTQSLKPKRILPELPPKRMATTSYQ